MAKQKKKSIRSSPPSPSKAGDLKAQLARLPAEQLIAIVETFLARVSEKQRLEFLNLLPAVRSEDLEVHLPYHDDEDFIAEVEDFFERLRNEEFVEYVAYDPEEHAHRGYGDDSWIEEMDRLFETAELYFLARHYETAEQAYQTLFECFEIEGYCFTTSDPQAALKTNLTEARRHYFESLRGRYSGSEMAERIIEGFSRYRYIGKKPPQIHELFPEDDEVIRLLEAALIKTPSRDEARTILSALDRTAEMLKQIHTHFRSLEDLDRFAETYGERHPWAYEDLLQAYAAREDWAKVFHWAERGLKGKGSRKQERHAILADYKARAAGQLGDPSSALAALWDAFKSEADLERYAALREAALAAGEWDAYYPRVVERLTHDFPRKSYSLGQLWDHRLLVEALLVEGDYEQAVKQAARSDSTSWDEKEDARRSLMDFFLHSVTRAGDGASDPEIARRLGQPTAFIKRFGKELFQAPLSAADRDRQIDWIVQMLRPRIERIVKGKSQREYADAAHDTRLIAELHHLQGQNGKGQRFVASLHAQYQRHRNFRAELKNLGLD
jgi:hypothetical protein